MNAPTLSLSALLFLTLACDGGPRTSAMPTAVDAGPDDVGLTPDAPTPTPVAAEWDVMGGFTINGFSATDGIKSAVARWITIDDARTLTVELTSLPAYCDLLRSGGCLPDGEVDIALTIYGEEPGTYELARDIPAPPGTFRMTWTSIDTGDCRGVGIGPSTGTLRLLRVEGDAVWIEFETALSFVTGDVPFGGSATAPICHTSD
jgi:hypothetical protein